MPPLRGRTPGRATVAALLLLLSGACGGGEEPAQDEKPAFQIAFVTGTDDGTAARRGIDLAIDELNADTGRRFRYSYSSVDDGSAAASATEVCQRLVGVEGLAGVIASQGPATLAPCSNAVQGSGLPYLSIVEPSGEICADNLFHVAPLPNQLADAQETAREFSGVITVSDYLVDVQLPENDRFIAGLAARDSTAVPAAETARAYDAVHLLAAAAEAAGSAERAAVLAALPAVRFEGPRGPVSFPAGVRFATLNMFIGRTSEEGRVEPVSFRPAVAPRPDCG